MIRTFIIFMFYSIYIGIGYLIHKEYPDISNKEYEIIGFVLIATISLHIIFKILPFWIEVLGNKLSDKIIKEFNIEKKGLFFKVFMVIATFSILFGIVYGLFSIYTKNVDISEEKSLKYDKKLIAEFNDYIKQKNTINELWVQPDNKTIPCKLYFDEEDKKDYSKVYWDGDCKNGYATGLGREILKSESSIVQQIGLYYKGRAKSYCYAIYDEDIYQGTCNYENNVEDYAIYTIKSNNNSDVLIGSFGTFDESKPSLLIEKVSNSNNKIYSKEYSNFSYKLYDFSKNKNEKRKYKFLVLDSESRPYGFSFEIMKNGNIHSVEYINGEIKRNVNLPDSYISKSILIINEIKQATNKALIAYKKAEKIKKEYLNKICNKSVSVDFMDNDEYKEICKDKAII